MIKNYGKIQSKNFIPYVNRMFRPIVFNHVSVFRYFSTENKIFNFEISTECLFFALLCFMATA